jgi:small subunit ribosomal protein S16
MLMIRLARFGAKKKPTYRVVVIDKESARDSRAVEVVGTYNPITKPKAIILKHDRIAHWMKNGAQPSDTVARLLRNNPAPPPAAAPAA